MFTSKALKAQLEEENSEDKERKDLLQVRLMAATRQEKEKQTNCENSILILLFSLCDETADDSISSSHPISN